jgi:hypothetical protein
MRQLSVLLLAPCLLAQSQRVYDNFSADLLGTTDTRLDTWGATQAVSKALPYFPPTGFKLVLDAIDGDIIAFPTNKALMGTVPEVPLGYAGILGGFLVTNAAYSQVVVAQETLHLRTRSAKADGCAWCVDTCPFYRQGAVGLTAPYTSAFDVKFPQGYVIPADNKLTVVLASFLNTIGYIHIEITYAVTSHFVPADASNVSAQVVLPDTNPQKPAVKGR